MEKTNQQKINDAWYEEASIRSLGLLPAPSREIQQALIPPGGDWQCRLDPGAVTRSIFWNSVEAALINPRGVLRDDIEGDIAMGICATPVMDKALRAIFALAYTAPPLVAATKEHERAAILTLIAKVARAAIGYVERPAPERPEPEEEPEPEPEDHTDESIGTDPLRGQRMDSADVGETDDDDEEIQF